MRNSYFQFLPCLVQVQTDSKLPDSGVREQILLKMCSSKEVMTAKGHNCWGVISCKTTINIDKQSSRLILDY